MNVVTKFAWHIYGNFYACNNGFPAVNDIVRYYRQFRNKTERELAALLKWSVSDIEEIVLGVDLLLDEPRREALAACLNIPPILMGLPPFSTPLNNDTEGDDITPEAFNTMVSTCGIDTLSDSTINTYIHGILRDLSVSGCGLKDTTSESNIAYWIQTLTLLANKSRGLKRDQYLWILFEFYYCAAWHAERCKKMACALHKDTKALELGYRLANAELIISALRRRIGIYVEQERYDLAVQDLERAIFYGELFYASVNNPKMLDANRALDVSDAYICVEDACPDEDVRRRLRMLRERALQVAYEGQKANPREVFAILERWGDGMM